jgi:hypothetical protein
MPTICIGRRLAVACLSLAALAGGGTAAAAAQRAISSTAAHPTVASGAPAATASEVRPAAPAGEAMMTATSAPSTGQHATPSAPAQRAQASPATAVCVTDPSCCPLPPPPPPPPGQPQPQAASFWSLLSPCGQPLISDPTGENTFMASECAGARYVAVGGSCATANDPDSVAVDAPGPATSGEAAVSTTGTAYACGGPLPIAFSGGSSSSCRGALPAGAQEGGLSMNGG